MSREFHPAGGTVRDEWVQEQRKLMYDPKLLHRLSGVALEITDMLDSMADSVCDPVGYSGREYADTIYYAKDFPPAEDGNGLKAAATMVLAVTEHRINQTQWTQPVRDYRLKLYRHTLQDELVHSSDWLVRLYEGGGMKVLVSHGIDRALARILDRPQWLGRSLSKALPYEADDLVRELGYLRSIWPVGQIES